MDAGLEKVTGLTAEAWLSAARAASAMTSSLLPPPPEKHNRRSLLPDSHNATLLDGGAEVAHRALDAHQGARLERLRERATGRSDICSLA